MKTDDHRLEPGRPSAAEIRREAISDVKHLLAKSDGKPSSWAVHDPNLDSIFYVNDLEPISSYYDSMVTVCYNTLGKISDHIMAPAYQHISNPI